MKGYRVTLEVQEREELTRLVSVGKAVARKLTHARILLMADESPRRPGPQTTRNRRALDRERHHRRAGAPAVRRAGAGSGAWCRRPSKRIYTRKLDGPQEAQLIALACSKPPRGKKRWTLRLLADQMVELEVVDSLSHETVRQTL